MLQDDQRQLTPEMPLIDVLRLKPATSAVFEDAGIDYACGGATTVRNAAAQAGLTANELLLLLELRPQIEGTRWERSPLHDLTRFLTRDHEHMSIALLPRVRASIDAAIDQHGELPVLRRLRELAAGLAETISSHASSEEQELFPIVERLEVAASSRDIRTFGPRISPRVLRELIEHEDLRDRVHAMRDLSKDLLVDHDVEILSGHMRAFQKHLHVHMHLENNVLYPRAIAFENELRHANDGELVHA